MHTTFTPFTLHPWREGKGYGRRTGWRGTSAEFGEVTVEAPLRQAVPETLVSELRGGLLPETSYETRGVHTDVVRLPTLNRATLRLGDALVAVERNRLGLTMAAAGVDWHLTLYGQGMHAFTDPSVEGHGVPGVRYDALLDRLSWSQATAFLDAALEPAPVAR